MLLFCDESWKDNEHGKKVGTLGAVALPVDAYNDLTDRVFVLAEKYFGFENARNREIKGKRLLSPYEFQREAGGQVSMKLSFARELLEELSSRQAKIFASVVFRREEVDLLCENEEVMDRPYMFLMERVHACMRELGHKKAIIVFDDRGLGANQRVALAYRNFLSRSRMGRSFNSLLRTPMFAYSHCSTGLQMADIVTTVINRYFTMRAASPRIPMFYSLVRALEWSARESNADGYTLTGIKVLGDGLSSPGAT